MSQSKRQQKLAAAIVIGWPEFEFDAVQREIALQLKHKKVKKASKTKNPPFVFHFGDKRISEKEAEDWLKRNQVCVFLILF